MGNLLTSRENNCFSRKILLPAVVRVVKDAVFFALI
jgi:hypothetical protein